MITAWSAKAVVVGLLATVFPQTPQPTVTTSPTLTVQQILTRMTANTAGLTSYQVPVRIDARVHKIITLGVSMSGDRYFKAPDKESMKMKTVPSVAKAFQNAYASLGTAATWLQTYDFTMVAPTLATAPGPIYELRAVYKRSSRVDHILLDVDANTFDPIEARWYYTNGATIDMNIEEQLVDGKYHLPSRETLDVTFPAYRGSAVVTYGNYVVNGDLSDSLFSSTPTQ